MKLIPQIILAIAGWLCLLATPAWGETVWFDPSGGDTVYVTTEAVEVVPPPPVLPPTTHRESPVPVADFPPSEPTRIEPPPQITPGPPPAIQPPPISPPPLTDRPIPPSPPPIADRPVPSPPPAPIPPSAQSVQPNLFAGGSDSLVARAVGHAEGTRTAAGSRTRAYEGHTDPGNGVWNLGSFSFQHCQSAQYNCTTPDQADAYQLRRLAAQAAQLRQRASALGLTLTLEEELNGIDLANQSPLAALGTPEAYPEHLARAKQRGLTGQTAILEGRVWSFWDTTAGRWDAPGLGNSESNIRYDQHRRMQAIARVLAVYQQQQGLAERVANQIIYHNRSASL